MYISQYIGYLFALHINFIYSKQWDLPIIQKITLAFSSHMNARCIMVVRSESSTYNESIEEFKLAQKFAKIKNNFNPQAAVTTFNGVLQRVKTYDETGQEQCSRPLYIVLDHESTKNDLLKMPKRYHFSDSLWLFFKHDDTRDNFFDDIELVLNSAVFAAIRSSDDRVFIREIYSVDGTHAKIRNIIGIWTESEGLSLATLEITGRRKNLYGKELRVTSIENWPVTSYHRKLENDGRFFDGFFAQVWFELEEVMNFSSIHIEPSEKISGQELPDGNWTGLFGMASKKEVDVLLTELSMTPWRLKVVEFMQPLLKTRYQFYLRFEGFLTEWSAVMHPFSAKVWLALVSWIFIASIAYFVFDWITFQYRLEAYHKYYHIKPIMAFYFVLQTFCSQGSKVVPKGWGLRWLFVLCYLIATVIIPSYSGALISALTKKTIAMPFDSVEGLLKHKFPLVVWSYSADYEIFSKATDQLFQNIYPMVNSKDDGREFRSYSEMYQYICSHEDVAMFGIERSIDVMVRELKDRSRIGCWPIKFNKGAFQVYQTIAFTRGSPYKDVFNYNMLAMRQAGILFRLEKQYFPIWIPEAQTPVFMVSSKEMMPLYTFLFAGILLSILILIWEILDSKSKPTKTIKFKN